MQNTQQPVPKNVVGIRVRQARQRPGVRLSQVGLSTCLIKAGLSVCRTAVSKIESGARYVADYELIGLAKRLQVSTAWLLDETTSYTGSKRTRRSVGAA